MAIKDEIQRITKAKEDFKTKLIEKGVTVSDEELISDYPPKLDEIKGGTDTTDATATASDIRYPKTAYINGGKVAGNIQDYDGSYSGGIELDNESNASGTIDITNNGLYDVETYKYANVNVAGGSNEGGINPTGTLDINVNGKYNVKNYEFVEVNITASGSGSGNIPLFAPELTASDTQISIKDNNNGTFVSSYVTTVNNQVIQDSLIKTVDLNPYFTDGDTWITKTYAKGLLPNSSVSNEINHYQVKFYNDNTLLETQVRLEGNKATYPTTNPVKQGYDFLGYALDKNSTERSKLEIYNPTSFYAIFGQGLQDVIYLKNAKVSGKVASCTYNNKIYIFGSLNEYYHYDYKVLCYDPATDTLTAMNTAMNKSQNSCAVVGNKVYICDYTTNKNMYVYDLDNDTLETITLSISVVSLYYDGQKLYARKFSSGIICEYDFSNKQFIELDTSFYSPENLFVVYDGVLYLHSSNNLIAYNLTTKTQTKVSWKTISDDSDDYGYAIKDGVIYIFGTTKTIGSYDTLTGVGKIHNTTLYETSENVNAVTFDNKSIYVFDGNNVMKYT